ncbi:MAG: pyridoxal-phosphate dependent enzyme, partial [Halobacteriales archaeon]|nr:pyridoxal-phosphate dependent enzyme [Halobacteriales archaeon]
MWERGAPLPASAPAGLPKSVGGTPLVRVPSLDRKIGCQLSIKDETRNPTGTFKDRG